MNLTLRQIEAFLAVAQLRSFTAAGRSLHITQSAVSGLIKDLEAQIAVPLFDRSSRTVSLSPDGEKFMPVAQRAFQEFERAERLAQDLKTLRSSVVRIAGAPLIACTLLPVYIAKFAAIAPSIRVELLDEPMAEVQRSVQSGEASLGFGPERLLEHDIQAQTLFATPVSMLSRPDHPLVGAGASWEEVKKTPLIAVGRESIAKISSDVGGGFSVAHVVNHMPTACALSAAGQGVVVAGPFSMLLGRGYGLTITPLNGPVLQRNMMVYTCKNRELPVPAMLFLSFVREYIREVSPNGLIHTTLADAAG